MSYERQFERCMRIESTECRGCCLVVRRYFCRDRAKVGKMAWAASKDSIGDLSFTERTENNLAFLLNTIPYSRGKIQRICTADDTLGFPLSTPTNVSPNPTTFRFRTHTLNERFSESRSKQITTVAPP
jgi:hypothetical protein